MRVFNAINERPLFLGLRPRDSMIVCGSSATVFLLGWMSADLLIGIAGAIAVLAAMYAAIQSLYRHSLYWMEYSIGKNAYKSDVWVA